MNRARTPTNGRLARAAPDVPFRIPPAFSGPRLPTAVDHAAGRLGTLLCVHDADFLLRAHTRALRSPMDDSMGSAARPACTGCGSLRLAWRVRRVHAAGNPASARTLLWTCADCGSGWEEPLTLGAASFDAPGMPEL
jgi:hypothetical protein